MPSDDLPNYVAYRWFYFPYGWEKQKMRDMFEALVKVITQKFRTLVNSLLNREKENLPLDRFRILGPSWITLYFGRQHPGVDLVVRLSRCLSHTTEAVALLDRHLAISGHCTTLSSIRAASSVWMTGLHVSENTYLSPHSGEKTPKVILCPEHPLE